MNLAEAIPRIAQEEGIPAEYLDAKVRIESGYNQAARSRSGAIGYGQLMPATARGLGVDPTDPESNLRGAARYLNQMYKQFGDWDLAAAAYNAGPNAVLRHGGIPPYEETRNHVRKFNEALAAPSPVLGGASAAPVGGAFSSTAPVAGSAGALQQLAQSILEGNLGGASRPTASDPLARIAQAGLVDPFAPKPARMAASGDFFRAMEDSFGGLTEPVAAAVRSVMGGGAPANNIRPLDISAGAPMPAGGGAVPIAQVGRALEQAGLRVREHPDFGGVGQHSPGSLHYKGLALDLTDWQDPGEKESSWRPRKAALGQRMAEILGPAAQVLHPGNDGAHGSHIHLGIPSGRLTLDQVQAIVQARQETLRAFPFRWAG